MPVLTPRKSLLAIDCTPVIFSVKLELVQQYISRNQTQEHCLLGISADKTVCNKRALTPKELTAIKYIKHLALFSFRPLDTQRHHNLCSDISPLVKFQERWKPTRH